MPVCALSTDAAITRGNALINVASTSVSVLVSVTSFSRASLTIGDNWPPSSWMISINRLESNTVAASDSDPNAAREQPNRF